MQWWQYVTRSALHRSKILPMKLTPRLSAMFVTLAREANVRNTLATAMVVKRTLAPILRYRIPIGFVDSGVHVNSPHSKTESLTRPALPTRVLGTTSVTSACRPRDARPATPMAPASGQSSTTFSTWTVSNLAYRESKGQSVPMCPRNVRLGQNRQKASEASICA